MSRTTSSAAAAPDPSIAPGGAGEIPRQERINLWVTCAAQFLTLAGMTAILPLLPLYLQHIGVHEHDALRYWTGVLGAAPFIVAVFATPMWGAFADRVGHKPMVVRSVFGIAAATIGMGFSSTPVALLGWRGLQGAVSGVFPAAVGLLSALTPEPRMSRSLAILQSSRAAGSLCGPLIGGVLADLVGIRALFFGAGAVAIATAVLCAFVLEEPPRSHASSHAPPDIRWRDLMAERSTLGMLGLLIVFQITVMCSWPTLALFVERFGVPKEAVASTTGVVVFAAGLPVMLTATTWARLGHRYGIGTMLIASLVLTGAANLATGLLVTHIGMLVLWRALAGLSMAGFIPLAFEWLNARALPHARGRTAGIGSTAMMLGNVIGPLLGGWLAVRHSLAATFWLPGAGIAVLGLVLAAGRMLDRR